MASSLQPLSPSPSPRPEPIAIIGSACRFPGDASCPSKLWELLSSPRDVLSKITPDRFDPDGFYHPDGEHHGATNVHHSYLLSENTRHFDAAFFALNAREAQAMDPQHRILLETVYESMESAGITISQLQGTQTGVYVGLMTNDYHDLHLRDMETIPKYTGTGTTRSILSNRVSYFFDWKGPSMTIDTACSSSLVSVHLAVQSLRSGESRVAIAAGANLIFGPEMYIIESKLHMLSPNGRSRMWDDQADGYGRGEGVGAIMLKPLSDAIRDGDHIECIIRETGVNQDGRTPGITMPNARSQEALIRDTYRRAGLDLKKREDRPQFFEAHGTGTPVGDPLEAEAISNAFFSSDTIPANVSSSDVLYVGGIKTVIGHLEGAAGLAGLIKAALALKHGILPPNMLLDNLNPKLDPFIKYLRVPTTQMPWPEVPDTAVRRASVNSFGFGGTNAHVILESADDHIRSGSSVDGNVLLNGGHTSSASLTPLVFSAYSDASLIASIKAFVGHLTREKETDLRDLAWTLQARRTEFSHRKSFSGSHVESLLANMSKVVRTTEETPSVTVGIRASPRKEASKVLGVFTGQGAQWPAMGAELLHTSAVFSDAIDHLETSLRELADGPTWSIRQELTALGKESRVHQAEISQPLCTAVQIGLVNLIRVAGISLHTVVGHSSGEISAAYAAGVISARDAIRIAYYRGVYTKYASGRAGQPGSMMAAGLSFDEARKLCAQSRFEDRISVAASNGPSTVTLSGDEDAMQQLKLQLDEQKTFNRTLKVDKAYHSHHMLPCREPYLQSLQACKIEVSESFATSWVSSVLGVPGSNKSFNLSTVVERAVTENGAFDIAIEIGPHAALKGPTTQTIKAATEANIPYQGILSRGQNDTESFASALGYVWEHLGSEGVKLSHFTTSLQERLPILQKDLPIYQWDHQEEYWKESRLSKNFRVRDQPIHELLGKQCVDNVEACDLRWRNTLSVTEMPWLQGHKFQNQILFPAAGHVALALEASKALAGGKEVRLIELEDISIGKAITIEEEGPEVEILFTLKAVTTNQDQITADFACYACHNETSGNMDQCSSGRITMHLGAGSVDILPPRPAPISGLVAVDTDDFYDSMDQIGLDYTEDFRKIDLIRRTRSQASARTIKPATNTDYAEIVMVHPALLDICFQTVIAAFSFPSDGSFWTPYLPTKINHIRVNPLLSNARQDPQIHIDARIVNETSLQIIGDLNAYNARGEMEIQLEGLVCSSFSKATPANDQLLFAETVWKPAITATEKDNSSAGDYDPIEIDAIEVNERVAYFYLRTLREKFSDAQVATFEWWYQRLFEFADHLLPIVASGTHPSIRAEWANDSYETIQKLASRHPDQVDLQLVVEVGEHLPTYVCGKVPLLEVMLKEDRLTRLYQDGLGVPRANKELAAIAKQLSHQHPGMKILEIGAGTGGMTKEVLREIDGAFGSYTFTDISTGFFEKSKERLDADGRSKMIFSALDIEKDPAAQGYPLDAYDVIIASNVLHATRTLSETMAHVRSLLRPGGYLLLNEVTGEMLRLRFIMSGLPGWWLGGDDGRRYAPTITSLQWDETLREAGFSGVDNICHDYAEPAKQSMSVITTQAVDEMVDFLREPLLSPYMAPGADQVFIVGGKSLHNRRLVRAIAGHLRAWTPDVIFVDDLLALEAAITEPGFTALCLDDLDEPVLQDINDTKLEALKSLFGHAKNVVYLTLGSRSDSPYSMAMVGLGRTALFEYPDLNLQFIDLATITDADPFKISEDLLRLVTVEGLDPSYLWTAEPEIAYQGSKKYIQRLVPNKTLNNQLNSERRLITEIVSTKDWQVVLDKNEAGTGALRQGESTSSLLKSSTPGDHTLIDVSVSVVHPVNLIGAANIYISIGKQGDLDGSFVVLSTECASSVVVPTSKVSKISSVTDNEVATTLRSIAMHLLAQQILSAFDTKTKIVLHEPDEPFVKVMLSVATEKGVSVILTTSDSGYKTQQSWQWFHPFESFTRIHTALPSDIGLFIDFSSGKLGERMASCMPKTCLALRSPEIFRDPRWNSTPSSDPQQLSKFLSQACLSVSMDLKAQGSADLRADEILPGTKTVPAEELFSIIDWTHESPVTVQVVPTITKHLFSPEKTYILFGLSGELGRSLTNYMLENGARYIVMTSRNPPAVDAWVEQHRERGATVKILANNITNKPEVQSFVDQIRKTMPPIGGVANGAMVLQDKLFANMNLDDWNTAVNPKVDGSQILNEIFSTDGSLEFFVMFSSLASVIGNSGQSNYNAGNLYCCALAANRRKRGLAASVLDIGKIVGIGYVSRNQKAVISLRSHKFQPISEPLFHHMFAEAVISGQSSDRLPVLSAGMQKRLGLAEEDSTPPLWLGNPRFSHMKWVKEGSSTSRDDASAAAKVPVKELLTTAKNTQEAEDVLCGAFTTRLATILQLSTDSINKGTPMIDIGIDSLIAVEVRSWFLKELNVDLPVLKIIGGYSILELCRDALNRASLELGFGEHRIGNGSEEQAPEVVTELGDKKTPLVNTVEVDSSDDGVPSLQSADQESSLGESILPSDFAGLTENTTWNTSPITTPAEGKQYPVNDSMISLSLELQTKEEHEVGAIAPTTVPPSAVIREGLLSHAQERLWLAHSYADDKKTYNVAFAWELKGRLQTSKFQSALELVGKRHETLRTSYHLDEISGVPRQSIHKTARIPLEIRNIGPEGNVHAEFESFRNHTFDLPSGQTMKVAILQVSADMQVFLLCYHHIVMDGMSLRTFLFDLNRAYSTPVALLRPTSQYLDYAVEQNEMIRNGSLKQDLQYWTDRFSTPMAPLPLLPFSRATSRFPFKRYDTFTAYAFVGADTVTRIKDISRRAQSPSFHFYATSLQVLLFRLLEGSVNELCFGIADANRLNERYVDTLGFFLNLLPVRFRVHGEDTFMELIKKTRSDIYGAMAHSSVPFDVLLGELNPVRSPTYNPLFQVLLNYTLGIREQGTLAGCEMDLVEIEDANTACDLVVSIVEATGKDTAVSFTTQRGLYLEEDCTRLVKLYVDLLDNLSRSPELLVNEINPFKALDITQAIDTGKGEFVKSWPGWERTISHQVDLMASTYPGEVAVKLGLTEEYWTYHDLNERSKYIAQDLLNVSGSPQLRVAILSESSLHDIASILAILRIGGSYIPLDPRNPRGRLSSIISDSSPAILLCDDSKFQDATSLGEEHSCRVINMTSISISGSKFQQNLADVDSPAFALYTSGSTGTPKGIMLNHSNWLNQFALLTREFNLRRETVLQQSSPGFDMAIEQIFIALCNGGTLVIVPSKLRGDSVEITKLMLAENVTYSIAAPSEYSTMLRHGAESLRQCKQWKTGFCGGEKITDSLREEFHRLALPEFQLINVYGPTETTLSCCRAYVPLDMNNHLENHDFCPVGQVLPNYAIYIVGPDGHIVPTGFPGEIYIGGVGVGQGYMKREELNRVKFLKDIFAETATRPHRDRELMYRTGDRGRLLKDGPLVFMGRLEGDSQVKLRGQRIELEEIETVIRQASKSNLSSVIVCARGSEESTFLVAFAVFSSESSVRDADRTLYLRELSQQLPLPQYMRPASIIAMADLPLNINGKVDRRAVDAILLPSVADADSTFNDLNEDEAKLLALWKEILPAAVGFDMRRETDFFEAGGNSLLMVRLQSLIESKFDIKISLVDIVEFCSLGTMAQQIWPANNEPATHQVDWEQEASVPEPLDLGLASPLPPLSMERKVAILTGATGFLGQHILKLLVASPDIAEIHCIAVRKSGTSPTRGLPLQSDKVFVHYGDLTLPHLGLAPSEFISLSARADVIIHNAADVSFLKPYSSLKKSNVGSTSELVRLSAPRRIPIHFVSSAGVAGFVPPSLLPLQEISVGGYTPSSSGAHGYQAAKWVSERLLEKAYQKHGMAVVIHRPTGITGDGASSADIVTNFLQYSDKISAVPDMDGWDGFFNLIPVELVAETICSSVTRHQSSPPALLFIHECSDESSSDAFPVQELGKYLEDKTKRQFGILSMNEWIDETSKVGMSEMITLYLKEVTAQRIGSYPRVAKGQS